MEKILRTPESTLPLFDKQTEGPTTLPLISEAKEEKMYKSNLKKLSGVLKRGLTHNVWEKEKKKEEKKKLKEEVYE